MLLQVNLMNFFSKCRLAYIQWRKVIKYILWSNVLKHYFEVLVLRNIHLLLLYTSFTFVIHFKKLSLWIWRDAWRCSRFHFCSHWSFMSWNESEHNDNDHTAVWQEIRFPSVTMATQVCVTTWVWPLSVTITVTQTQKETNILSSCEQQKDAVDVEVTLCVQLHWPHDSR